MGICSQGAGGAAYVGGVGEGAVDGFRLHAWCKREVSQDANETLGRTPLISMAASMSCRTTARRFCFEFTNIAVVPAARVVVLMLSGKTCKVYFETTNGFFGSRQVNVETSTGTCFADVCGT